MKWKRDEDRYSEMIKVVLLIPHSNNSQSIRDVWFVMSLSPVPAKPFKPLLRRGKGGCMFFENA